MPMTTHERGASGESAMGSAARWRREWGLLLLVGILALPLFTPRLYASDEIKYFAHLRSMWFDHDANYFNEYDYFVRADPQTYAWLRTLRDPPSPTGRRLNDAPIGSAVLWAPFYIAADVMVVAARALGSSVTRDGYSAPYVWAVTVASLFWGMCGVALTLRICRREYARQAAQTAVLGVWFATPLVFYLYITPPMAHANSFFTVALFMWLWLSGRERERSTLQWVQLGAAAALMVLVRELNWLMLIPLGCDEVWNASRRWKTGRTAALVAPLPRQLAFVVTLAVLALPQFLMYQALHGTYGPTPFIVEKFSPIPRYVPQVLFSGFHGLFSWAPITLLGTVGLLWLARRQPIVALGCGLALGAQVLVIGSYATWPGGASFGARRFINCTPIFALGLAAAFAAVPAAKRRMAAALVIALIVWNFGLALQYATGIIPRDRPVTMTTIVANQFLVVPQRTVGVAWRFLTDRWSMVKTRPDALR